MRIRLAPMSSVFEYLLYAVAIYWATLLYQRWLVHSRTRRFVLDQRRKAGIPDSDHRPLAIAAADAAHRREQNLERSLGNQEDVFGPAHGSRALPVRPTAKLHPRNIPRHPLPIKERAHVRPVTKLETFNGPIVKSSTPIRPSKPNTRPVNSERVSPARKRHAEEVSDVTSAEPLPRVVRRKIASWNGIDEVEETNMIEDDLDEEEELPEKDMEDLSYEGSDIESEDELSDDNLENASEEVLSEQEGFSAEDAPARAGTKRPADTTNDHGPGDEWRDANGLSWRIGDDGIPRRAVILVEMKPKFNMPRDATHPDARVRVPTQVERFLTHEEYEDAKRQKLLSWQHDLTPHLENPTASPPSFVSDTLEDSLASLVSRRSRANLRKLAMRDYLHGDAHNNDTYIGKNSILPVEDSFGHSSLGDQSNDNTSLTSTLAGADTSAASRRLRLAPSRGIHTSRSTTSSFPSVLNQRYSRSLSERAAFPSRTALDEEAKRKREQRLMENIQAERKSAGAENESNKQETQKSLSASSETSSTKPV